MGRRLSEVSLAGLESIPTDYTCTGSESNLADCLNSTLAATCTTPVIAAVGCQGTCTCVGVTELWLLQVHYHT